MSAESYSVNLTRASRLFEVLGADVVVAVSDRDIHIDSALAVEKLLDKIEEMQAQIDRLFDRGVDHSED